MTNLLTIEHINAKKFSFFNNETFIKPYTVINYNPEYIVNGNSVANTAFDTNHAFFEGKKTFSYGMAGSGIYTNYRTYQHIQDKQPEKVLHVIDFSSFFSQNPTNNTSYIEKSDTGKRLRFRENNEKNSSVFLQKIKDYGLLLFSWEIAIDSLETIRRQQEDGWFLRPDGTWGGGSSQTGKPQRKRFLYVEKEIFIRPFVNSSSESPFFLSSHGENTLDYFRNYLSILYKNKTATTLLIPPAHARIYETLFMQNRWRDYKDWKRSIIRINEEVAAHHKQTPYVVWDFSGYNQFTTESVPSSVDKSTRMKWFYDSVHIKPALGTAALDVMVGHRQNDTFGSKITSMNVDAQLNQMYQGHIMFQKTNTLDSTEIHNLCVSVFHDPQRCTEKTEPYGHDNN